MRCLNCGKGGAVKLDDIPVCNEKCYHEYCLKLFDKYFGKLKGGKK